MKWFAACWSFIADVFVATMCFGALLFGAYLLQIMIGFAEDAGLPDLMIKILVLVEYIVFFIDIIGYLYLVIIAMLKFATEIRR